MGSGFLRSAKAKGKEAEYKASSVGDVAGGCDCAAVCTIAHSRPHCRLLSPSITHVLPDDEEADTIWPPSVDLRVVLRLCVSAHLLPRWPWVHLIRTVGNGLHDARDGNGTAVEHAALHRLLAHRVAAVSACHSLPSAILAQLGSGVDQLGISAPTSAHARRWSDPQWQCRHGRQCRSASSGTSRARQSSA